MYSSWICIFLIMRVTEERKQVLDYHEHVGIPMAEWIKEKEDEIQARPVSGRRIVGGSVAPPHLHPYLGGLIIEFKNKKKRSVCGSSLITIHNLVTAAHCWKSVTSQAYKITVVLASEFLFTGGTRIVASNIVMHPKYDPVNFFNDLAIIYLQKAIPSSDFIKPIDLPHLYLNRSFDYESVIAVGYGRTKSKIPVSKNSVISHVELIVLPEEECELYFVEPMIRLMNICTDGTDGAGACDGDSGGPLISVQNGQPFLIGVASFAAEGECEEGYPSVFTRVTSFLHFILKNL